MWHHIADSMPNGNIQFRLVTHFYVAMELPPHKHCTKHSARGEADFDSISGTGFEIPAIFCEPSHSVTSGTIFTSRKLLLPPNPRAFSQRRQGQGCAGALP